MYFDETGPYITLHWHLLPPVQGIPFTVRIADLAM